jgi:hypothetical protein
MKFALENFSAKKQMDKDRCCLVHLTAFSKPEFLYRAPRLIQRGKRRQICQERQDSFEFLGAFYKNLAILAVMF